MNAPISPNPPRGKPPIATDKEGDARPTATQRVDVLSMDALKSLRFTLFERAVERFNEALDDVTCGALW